MEFVLDAMFVEPACDLFFALAFGHGVERRRGGQTLGGLALEFLQERDLIGRQGSMTERQAKSVERAQVGAQLFRGAACGGGGIVQFVRHTGQQRSHSRQLLAFVQRFLLMPQSFLSLFHFGDILKHHHTPLAFWPLKTRHPYKEIP